MDRRSRELQNLLANLRALMGSTQTFTFSGGVSIATMALLIFFAANGVFHTFEGRGDCEVAESTKMGDVRDRFCVVSLMLGMARRVLNMNQTALLEARGALGEAAGRLDVFCANLSGLTVAEARSRSTVCLQRFLKEDFIVEKSLPSAPSLQ